MKMMFLRKLGVILLKNLLLRRTQWFITSMELLLPILLVGLVCWKLPSNDCYGGREGRIEDMGEMKLKEAYFFCNNISVSYAPMNKETNDAVARLRTRSCSYLKIKPYENETELQKNLQADTDIGLVFPDGLTSLNDAAKADKVISYKIMAPASKVPTSKMVLPPQKLGDKDFSTIGPNYYHAVKYLESNFLNLQLILDKILAEMITGQSFSFDIGLQGFAYYLPPGFPRPRQGPFKEPWVEEYGPNGYVSKLREPEHYQILKGALVAKFLIPVFLCFSVLFTAPTITRNVVSEKQTGIAELLKSTGASGLIQWLGWMINCLVPFLFSMSICTVLLLVRVAPPSTENEFGNQCQPEAVIARSDWTLVWFMLFLYSISTMAFCFFICAVIRKPTIATSIAVLLLVVTMILPIAPVNKMVLSVFPNCAMTFAFLCISKLDILIIDDSDRPLGAQWDWEILTFSVPDDRRALEGISLMETMGMLLVDFVVYSLLALYFENVLPSEHGVRRPWYLFNSKECFSKGGKGYQRGLVAKQGTELEKVTTVNDQESGQENGGGEGENGKGAETVADEKAIETSLPVDPRFEPEVDKGARVGIELQKIYKSFGNKMAVNGLSLRMYEGDIFALLGHNGAGKTTLISMITGFFSPTSGTAIVNGYDVRDDMESAREHMGLCPQHNMVFENLSVINQLVIFGMLRGLGYTQAKGQAHHLLLKMNLIDKKTTLARKLSGGQKRKLSLAMALIGGTRIIVLDEPTSGMDPQARREIWDLLLEFREGKTILLTTHFMEEADVLGDRIGIMAAGKLQCCGTTSFLKKHYGTGVTLKLTLKQKEAKDPSNTTVSPPETDSAGENPETAKETPENVIKILAAVQKYIPNASVKKDARSDANSSEVFLALPAETATTETLTTMFAELNGNKDKLGILTIGLQEASMDDVFIRVGELAEEDQSLKDELVELDATQQVEWVEKDDFEKVTKLEGGNRLLWQFLALLIKKWILSKRKWVTLLIEILITLFLILGATFILQDDVKSIKSSSNPKNSNQLPEQGQNSSDPQPPLLISLDKHKSPISFYHSSENSGMESHIQKVLGSSSEKYTQDPTTFKESLALVGKSDIKKYKRRMIIAITSNSTSSITAMFNPYAYHAAPLALNTATNIALQAMKPSANHKIQVITQPWGHPEIKKSRSVNGPGTSSRICHRTDPLADKTVAGSAILLLLAFILFTSIFIAGPTEEKITNVKQLQLMTGLQPASYWLSHFVYDYTLYFLVVLLSIVLIFIFESASGIQVLVVNHGAGVLFLILMCYGFSSIALAYLLSLRSSTVAGGYTLVLLIHLFAGIIIGFILIVTRKETYENSPVTFFILLPFKIMGYMTPDVSALMALVEYLYLVHANSICDLTNAQLPQEERLKYRPYIEWDGVGQELFYLLLVGVVYVAWLMLSEYKVCRTICGRETPPPFPPNILDDDVYQEADRVNCLVQSGQTQTECMVIQNLSKAFGGFAAVSQVSFGVHYGECFGLLGVNGAGKTTVFKMITGEEFPSGGNIFGFGTSLEHNSRDFFSNIGYCPQFDAIFVKFTGREMLELFGVLRGLPYNGAKMDAIKWLRRFGLIESADVRCGKYSGGMKRRLSTAMAMIGDPALLLLDEPTSGVDPVSRHQFWGILEKIRDSGKSIILTSHSMDECEALCSRLGIMVNGQFQCFGGVQHLKTKFAQGYSLTIKLKPDMAFGTPEIEEKLTKLQEKINETFKPCELKDKHQNLLQYHLQDSTVSWDALFKKLEGVKKEYENLIEDYNVNETSLENVFLAFAKSQYGERRVQITTCAQICTCRC